MNRTMPNAQSTSRTAEISYRLDAPRWVLVLPFIFLAGLNAITLSYQFPKYPNVLTAPGMDLVALINATIAIGTALLRHVLLQPWRNLAASIAKARQELTPDSPALMGSMDSIASEVTRLSALARESYARYTHASRELEQAREAIAQYRTAQHTIIHSASREMTGQYQSVLAYANYLEAQIDTLKQHRHLREDFDDVTESSFNLKLIASALELCQRQPILQPLSIASTMQHMMLALVPSLERRSMKLSSAEVDTTIQAYTDSAILTHVLWMMHLGIVRYAEAESTLRLRCLYDHHQQHVLVSIAISELAPGQLSPDERGQYLERQMQHLNPHMFAETVRIHANIQLAELLLATVGGTIGVVALNAHACEICVTLPAAPNTAKA